MSQTTYGWLVLAFPLLGTLTIALGYRKLPGRSAGWIGTGAIFLAFLAALGALMEMQGHAPEHRQVVSSLWSYASTVGVDAQMSILVDPLSVFMILVVTGVSTLIHLYSISYMTEDRGFARYFAYLNFFVFSMLLLVLAGNFVLLIVGWAFVGAASYLLDLLLVPAQDCDGGGDQGVRDQRRRRRRARARDVLHLQAHGHARFAARVPRDQRRRIRLERRWRPDGRLPAAARRRVRQVGADPAAHVAARRDGRPDAGQRADPCGDDGHGRRLPDRAHAPAVRTGAGGRGRRRGDRRGDAPDRGHDRDHADGHQARDRLLDDVADRLHDHGRVRRRLRGGAVPPDDARLLQGAAVHGRGLDHRRDGRRAVAGEDGRLSQGDAVHLRLLHRRRPGAVGPAAVLGLLLQGRDPARHRRARRLALGALRGRLHRRAADGDLHVPDDLPRLPRRAGERGGGARRRPPAPRRAADEPGQRRSRGHRRRLPGPVPHDRRARAADARGDVRSSRSGRSARGSCRSRKSTS